MEQPLSASIERSESVVLLLSLRLHTLSIYFRRIEVIGMHYSLAQCCLEDSEVKNRVVCLTIENFLSAACKMPKTLIERVVGNVRAAS